MGGAYYTNGVVTSGTASVPFGTMRDVLQITWPVRYPEFTPISAILLQPQPDWTPYHAFHYPDYKKKTNFDKEWLELNER